MFTSAIHIISRSKMDCYLIINSFFVSAMEGLLIDASNTTTSQCQTPPQLSVDTPRKRKLRFLLKKKRTKISHLTSKLAKTRVNSQILSTKTQHEKTKMALELLKGVISKDLHSLLKSQVTLSSKQAKGRRYNCRLKSWALSIYHTSGKAYRFLQKIFHLPSKRTLSRMVSRFASEAGFSNKSLYVIQEKVKSLPAGADVCSLLMDEMSLKSHLFYSVSDDSIIGLEEYGNGKSSCFLATSALVFMVRGILYNWKQPIAYFLVNESCGTTQLHTILDEALLRLESLGLNVVSVVSDQGSNFL